MVVDHRALADEIDNFDSLTIDQKAAARRTVASFSTDATECLEFLQMLGIAPTQERDEVAEVNKPKLPKEPHPGRRRQNTKRA